MQAQVFAFGRFRFDAATGLLTRDGEPVALGRRGAALLAALVRRRGEVLTKSELIDAAWPDAAIEESNLSVQIATLRQLLGRSEDGRDWIVTSSRIGYRFIRDENHVLVAATSPLPLLAVRPFAARSGSPELAASFHDDLLIAQSRFKSFAVTTDSDPRTAFRSGHASGARYALEGSISRAGNELAVSVHLIDLTTRLYLWGRRYEGDAHDGAAIRDEIIGAVVAVVELQIQLAEIERSRRDRPRGTDAYDLYLRGQFHLGTSHPNDNAIAIGLFNDALELDPDNLLYLAGAAEAIQCRIAMGWGAYGADDRKASRDIAYRGLRRARDADAGCLSLFGMSLFNGGETDQGYATIQRAAELNPNSVMANLGAGHVSLHWGNLQDSEAQLRRAYRLNPFDPLQRFVLSASPESGSSKAASMRHSASASAPSG